MTMAAQVKNMLINLFGRLCICGKTFTSRCSYNSILTKFKLKNTTVIQYYTIIQYTVVLKTELLNCIPVVSDSMPCHQSQKWWHSNMMHI